MIVAFFGHSSFLNAREIDCRLCAIFKSFCDEEKIELYFGGYGAFDLIAYNCAKKYYNDNKKASFYFITPYITPSYNKNVLNHLKSNYDGIIYPPIESAPPRYAISYRNKWIAETADVIIVGVDREYGGAYAACKHAKRKRKRIINVLSDMFNK